MTPVPVPQPREWWRTAAIYQVYVRSFADGNGDGVGDLAGIRARLGYLADLGVDALWLNPWYPSPMVDAGYDVADYRDIDPTFGTLAEAEALIREAHTAGLRIIIDIVPNHCSSAHPWFAEAVGSGPGSAARELFWFRPGSGPDGDRPPNNWSSIFGGPAWTRVADGQWYLHLFAAEQPEDRKSTRLNSSHITISYAVFCFKKKTQRDLRVATSATQSIMIKKILIANQA